MVSDLACFVTKIGEFLLRERMLILSTDRVNINITLSVHGPN